MALSVGSYLSIQAVHTLAAKVSPLVTSNKTEHVWYSRFPMADVLTVIA